MAEWDNAHFLTTGADLSSLGAYGTLIQQAIEQAYPASTWYGPVIVAEDTPPVTGLLAFNKRALWIKPSVPAIYYYSDTLGSWDDFINLLTVVIEDASVTLAKLSTTGTASRRVLRRNSANTAYEWVDPLDVFNSAELTLAKLENAPASGYVIYSTSGSAKSWTLLSTIVTAQIVASDIKVTQLRDSASTGIAGQILALIGAGDYMQWNYVEDLLRSNSTPTDRLQYPAGCAGKWAKFNASGTNLEPTDAPAVTTPTVAILLDTGVSSTAAQVVGAAAVTTVRLNSAAKAQSWCALAANQFTLQAGTYEIHAIVPIYKAATGDIGYIALKSGASLVAYSNFAKDGSTDWILCHLVWAVEPGSSTTYEIDVYSTAGTALGRMNSIASIPEVYTQVKITKYS